MRGFVYVLSNPSMPDLVKIGKTTKDVEQRASELFQTGVPEPFEIVCAFETPDCDGLEIDVHETLYEYRVSPNREFFRTADVNFEDVIQNLLYEQLYYLVNDYLPNTVIIDCGIYVKEDHIHFLAGELDEYYPTITGAMEHITPDELKPALARCKTYYASERKKRESKTAEDDKSLKVVG